MSKPIDIFLRFCVDANIDHTQAAPSMQKYLLAYQRNLQHRVAFDVLFRTNDKPPPPPLSTDCSGDDSKKEEVCEKTSFINWNYIEKNLPKLDAVHWISIFQYIDFTTVPCLARSELGVIQKNLKSLDICETLTCPVFLIKNTNYISAQLAVERLFCEYEVADAYNKSMRFFAMCADSAFEVADTTTTFCHVVRTCSIKASELDRQIQFIGIREQSLVDSFQIKRIQATGRRPRLRSKLSNMQKETRSVFDMDGFTSWCHIIRFPAVFSLHMRHRLYFLMAQSPCHVPEPIKHVHLITRDVFVCKALQETSHIQKPEPDVIHNVISAMNLIDGPFNELHDFRCACIGGFPVTQLNSMHLNDLLRLYVCAYQSPVVWKDIWKQLVPLLSHQIIRDVETFTQRKPFNFAAVLSIINRTSPINN